MGSPYRSMAGSDVYRWSPQSRIFRVTLPDFRCWHETDMPTAVRDVRSQGQSGKHMLGLSSSQFDPQRTSSWLWPALASALVANDWTVELTGLITSRGQRNLAPAGARSGAVLGPRWPHNFDSR